MAGRNDVAAVSLATGRDLRRVDEVALQERADNVFRIKIERGSNESTINSIE